MPGDNKVLVREIFFITAEVSICSFVLVIATLILFFTAGLVATAPKKGMVSDWSLVVVNFFNADSTVAVVGVRV